MPAASDRHAARLTFQSVSFLIADSVAAGVASKVGRCGARDIQSAISAAAAAAPDTKTSSSRCDLAWPPRPAS